MASEPKHQRAKANDRVRCLPILAAPAVCLAVALAVTTGCGKRSERIAGEGPAANEQQEGSSSAQSPTSSATEPAGGTPTSAAPGGWPAGEDPAQSVAGLGEHVKQLFSDYRVIQKQIFPAGWIKLRYRPESVTAEMIPSDAEGKPPRAVVKVRYQKVSSIIHPTEQAAVDDEDLLPYPAEETREAMTGRLFAKPWPPIDGEIIYALQDGRWVRVDYKTVAVGREGADWLDRIGVP